jgi:hypothetical protein
MIKSAKVVLELRFIGKRVPKQLLESCVIGLGDMSDRIKSDLGLDGHDVRACAYYEDFSGIPQVSVIDAIHKPDILGWFRLGRKKDVNEKGS